MYTIEKLQLIAAEIKINELYERISELLDENDALKQRVKFFEI